MARPQRLPPPPDRLDLRSLASMIWRRKWVLLIPLAVSAAAGYLVGRPEVLKPVYRCTSTLMMEFPQSLSGDLAKMLPSASMGERLARLENQIQSETFLRKVILATGMDKDPTVREWAQRNRSRYPDLTEEELVDLRLMKILREAIRMTSPRANIFRIAVEDHIPERARLIATTLTRAVIEANESARMDLLRATHEFSLEQLALYKQKLTEAERRLEEVRRKQAARRTQPTLVDASNLDRAWTLRETADSQHKRLQAEYDATVDSLAAAEPRLQAILLSLKNARWYEEGVAALEALEKKHIELSLRPGAAGEDPQSTAIEQARDLESLRNRALRMLAQGYPDQVSEARESLIGVLVQGLRLRLADFRVSHLQRLIEEHQGVVMREPEYELEINRLQEEVETNRTLYNAFVQQIAAAEISEAFEATRVGGKLTVLEPPQRPLKPVRPNRRALFLLAVLVGLGGGLGGVFFLEQHDPSLRDIRQVEEATGLKVLGTLPAVKDLQRLYRRADNGTLPPGGEARLREVFLSDNQTYHECRKVFLDLVRGKKDQGSTVLVTSARAGEGKTTASAFLAVTMAREAPQSRVILVDLDARRPALHRYFGFNPEAAGVRQILEEGLDLESALRKVWLPNMKVLPMGSSQSSRGLRLAAEDIRGLLERLRSLADYIVLDSPPNLPIPDALVAGQEVDAVLVVVKAGETPRRIVQRGVEIQLQFSDNVRGVLLNNVSEALPFYDDYRYYGYEYGNEPRRRSS
ncbi:MAG: AAA family ATPase [Candidatus Eisenbacteria bacterium]|nr:AAA family ATPase [Candidatus Eisenbacteria bacterium]